MRPPQQGPLWRAGDMQYALTKPSRSYLLQWSLLHAHSPWSLHTRKDLSFLKKSSLLCFCEHLGSTSFLTRASFPSRSLMDVFANIQSMVIFFHSTISASVDDLLLNRFSSKPLLSSMPCSYLPSKCWLLNSLQEAKFNRDRTKMTNSFFTQTGSSLSRPSSTGTSQWSLTGQVKV